MFVSVEWQGRRRVDREEAIAELRTLLPPGSTVYTEIAYVEPNGRRRDTHIKLYVLEDNEPRDH